MGSPAYWDERYSTGRGSGKGSRGEHASTKADAINAFMAEHEITSVVDWGCGDGYLTELIDLGGIDYCGVDVSRIAVGVGLLRFDHQYVKWNPGSRVDIEVSAELALSVDVLFHLTDDNTYREYMGKLFGSATKFVMVYAPSKANNSKGATHMRFRPWLVDVPEGWTITATPADKVGPWCFGHDA